MFLAFKKLLNMKNLKAVRKFSDANVESVYLNHIISEKKSDFKSFLIGMALCAFLQIFTHLFWWTDATGHDEAQRLISGSSADHDDGKITTGEDEVKERDPTQSSLFVAVVMGICGLGVLVIVLLLQNKKLSNSSLCPPVAVLIWTAMILVPISVRSDNLPLRVGLGWIMLESFLVWVTLPVRFPVAFLYSVCIGVSHTVVVAWKGKKQPLFMNQLLANVILLGASNLLGMMAFHFNDKRQRLAFLDTRQSLEVKQAMEAATKEQKRLLFSVLPRHLADVMAKDMEAAANAGGGEGGAFKKIYMNRHEPVSILFADIVGFTAMSAAIGSASKLVEILNDLFSTFDSLSDLHKQVRIKILGDCYYCICGAPEDNPEHAVLCVHMGLAVVDAIKVFQKRTNSAVDMRVGIHTGAVLAGILGQRQWQFDVYSEDVILANKMESSGRPGRVHISDRTLEFLDGQFEVEPGDGDAQEEKLRMAGIKTFFITKVIIPFISDSNADDKSKKGGHGEDTYEERLEAHLEMQHDNFTKSANKFTLQFKDAQKELEYSKEEDPSNGQSFFGLAFIVAATAAASAFIISFHIVGFTMSSATFIAISLIGSWIVTGRTEMLGGLKARSALAIICVAAATIANFSYLVPCFQAGNIKAKNSSALQNRHQVVNGWSNLNCYYPAYFSIFLALCLFSLTIMSNTASWLKTIVSALITGLGITVMNLEALRKAFSFSEMFSFPDGFDLILESSHTGAYLLLIFALMCWLNRQLESSSRSLFLQKYEVVGLGQQAMQLRERNEALMCNIMPQHVAEHFLDKTKNHDELYSHNYQEVGIFFASMPNFSDFYTEDAVNNQGLECLRFLNEVISDYDAILDYPQFKDKIIKIKTIGSTYMAASGLNPNNQVQPGDSMRERWRHLSLLVNFVFEMKSILDRINKESYNQFVLKIGVNHGPVTAGVIGATKPAYDVWGNTVNVASRMESTGKAGIMQVTEDCYKILRMYGYEFELRGYVLVKGKGELLTYFLIGRGNGELSDEEIEALENQATESVTLPPAEG